MVIWLIALSKSAQNWHLFLARVESRALRSQLFRAWKAKFIFSNIIHSYDAETIQSSRSDLNLIIFGSVGPNFWSKNQKKFPQEIPKNVPCYCSRLHARFKKMSILWLFRHPYMSNINFLEIKKFSFAEQNFRPTEP